MNLKKSGRILWIVAAVAMLAMVLQGCGGDDGVSPSTHMDVEEERDMYKADAARLQGELDTANADLATANASLETANADLAAANASLETAQGNVTMYMDMVSQLQMTLGDEMEPAADSVRGMLAAAEAARDTAQADLATAQDNVTTYMNMVTALQTTLGDEMEPAADSVRGMLAAAQDQVSTLMTEIEGDGTDENPGLRQQLADAMAHIDALEGGTAPELLDPIKTAASDAADAASDAAVAARTAANAAMTAAMNRATIQTGDANSAADAMDADAHADTAEAEAGKAATASQMAQDAMDTATATPQRMAAEAARDAAMDARDMAVDAQGEAEADAMMELKIDGTMNSVGGISVDADAPNLVMTTGTGATAKTVNTGFQADLQEETAGAVTGVDFVAATAPAEDTAYVQAVAARDIDIGKTVDSADDMARLAIVTQYVGSRTVKVYADNAGAADEVTTRAGMMSVIDGTDGNRNTDDDTYVALRSEGTYYPVDNTGGDADALEAEDVVTATAEGEPVFSFLDVGADGAVGGGDDVKVYVVLGTTLTDGSTTTYTYDVIDVMAPASDATTDGTAEDAQVTANIPEGTDYDHINFGVWAALDEDGASPSAHGIGFVQNIVSDGSMTPVMPNFGDATFNGNWVATVQMADPDGDGDISIQDGTAMMTADFEDNDVMVTLTGLATLEGDISENTFSGTEATVGTNTYGLTADEDFTGSFEGAFFGVGAAEAGGVFSFGSEDMEAGAFAGAFGGARD